LVLGHGRSPRKQFAPPATGVVDADQGVRSGCRRRL